MTLQEAKDEFARKQNFKDWADYFSFMFHTKAPYGKRELAWHGAMELYARSKWDEAIEAYENLMIEQNLERPLNKPPFIP